MMPGLLARALALVAVLGGLFWVVRHIEQRGYDRAQADCLAARAQLHAEATAILAAETDKTRLAEQALANLKNQQEMQDAANQKTVDDLSDRLRRAAGPAGRLRDPNAPQCGPGGGAPPRDFAPTAVAGAADRAEAGGLLSEQLSGLLRRLSREADDINAAYASCKADALGVRGQQ